MVVDNLWSMFDMELAKLKPKNLADLKRKIKLALQNIPQQHIENTIQSIPRRLQEIIAKKGGWTHH